MPIVTNLLVNYGDIHDFKLNASRILHSMCKISGPHEWAFRVVEINTDRLHSIAYNLQWRFHHDSKESDWAQVALERAKFPENLRWCSKRACDAEKWINNQRIAKMNWEAIKDLKWAHILLKLGTEGTCACEPIKVNSTVLNNV